ncbi:MAG: anaerobic ribonucleoside triphosphate reductase, partial [Firmicutes bacterium]|nr:anaerobic ribonucleoside triphosphate reductase [Bacillota bacterium]
MLKHIRKRNGEVVDFNSDKIKEAIKKAGEATDAGFSTEELNQLTAMVITLTPNDEVPTVEQIQDVVENVLIKEGFAKTAKAYILYRAEHTMTRQAEADLMDIYKELTFASAKDADIKRENANIDGDTAMGTMLKYGSEGSKYFIDNYILPKDIAAAHINGDIHIHDKDFYMLTCTCCQIDLLKLFKDGFSTGHGYLREPNGIISYSALACIAIQANQNEMHGGQSIPNFDYSMAPGVAKTYVKEYRKGLARYLQALSKMTTEESNEEAKKVCEEAGKPTLAGAAEYGEVVWSLLKRDFPQLSEEQLHDAVRMAADVAYAETDRATFQAMEALVHNLNTMNSRAGAQVPFSSLNYGTDTSPEGRMVVKNLLLATDSGL